MNNLKQKIQKTIPLVIEGFTKHRFTLLFIILGVAITFALLRTRSFIDIPRNEERYTEEALRIKYKSIDEEVLDQFSSADEDKDIEVDSDFAPDRQNPFTEQ